MKHVGIDISKNDFWASSGPISHKFDQSPEGFRAFLAWLDKSGMAEAVCVMEATGVYHLALAVFLREQGRPVAVVNPQRPYHHGRARMARVVNDASAARNIQDFAARNVIKGDWRPMPEQVERMLWWLRAADKAQTDADALLNRKESLRLRPTDTDEREAFIDRQIEARRREKQECERNAQDIAAKHYSSQRDLFASIPGIGPRSAMALLAFFCSRASIPSPQQALALAGLSLRRHESGTSIHKRDRISKTGQPFLRRCLYMAALSAIRHNPACKELFKRLVEKGKSRKLAILAVACKLLRQATAIWNTQQPFSAQKSNYSSPLNSANA